FSLSARQREKAKKPTPNGLALFGQSFRVTLNPEGGAEQSPKGVIWFTRTCLLFVFSKSLIYKSFFDLRVISLFYYYFFLFLIYFYFFFFLFSYCLLFLIISYFLLFIIYYFFLLFIIYYYLLFLLFPIWGGWG